MAKRNTGATVSVNTILQDHTPDVQQIVAQLRSIIRGTVPNAEETAHAVWHSINFTHPESGYFCRIFPRQSWATLVSAQSASSAFYFFSPI